MVEQVLLVFRKSEVEDTSAVFHVYTQTHSPIVNVLFGGKDIFSFSQFFLIGTAEVHESDFQGDASNFSRVETQIIACFPPFKFFALHKDVETGLFPQVRRLQIPQDLRTRL